MFKQLPLESCWTLLRGASVVAVLALAGPATAEDLGVAEGEMRIIVADADGSNPKLLTDLPDYKFQGSPTWSQDGKRIAFDAWLGGERHNSAKIIVVDADGSNPKVLGDGAMPSFSPRGQRIAISRYTPHSGVWVMSSQGPQQELIPLEESGWGADWSPDGSRIAFTMGTSGGANLRIIDLIDGLHENVFPEGDEPYRSIYWNFTWSPDSKQIVFKGIDAEEQSQLVVVGARGAQHGFKARSMPKLKEFMTWSPDGKKLLVVQPCDERGGRLQMYTLNADLTGEPELLFAEDSGLTHEGAAFSPDGKRLAISVRRPMPKKAEAE